MLESQYQSSLTKACQRINESRDDVCVECVGYLLEELRDPKNVAAFKKDVESSNIFIGSLIFVQVRALRTLSRVCYLSSKIYLAGLTVIFAVHA